MFHAYILRCADGSYFTGHTDDLAHSLAEHQAGAVPGHTQDRLPVELVWSEAFAQEAGARDRAEQVGEWSRKKKDGLLRGDWSTVSSQHVSDAPAATRAPVVVLVRPQLGQNIGKAARAMLNFGLVEMRLVAPRDGWPNPEAGPAASGADQVLRDAVVYETVAEAVADCAHVYATTVRKRGITKPVVTPEAAATAIRAEPGRSAILFGPERSGLETDDVALARTILTVPINPDFGSLNLAQAVILVAYEWSKGEHLASPPVVDLGEAAPHEELEGMIGQLDDMLEAARFYYPPERAATSRRTLRTLLTKPGWTSQEIRTLRGVLSALDGAKRRR